MLALPIKPFCLFPYYQNWSSYIERLSFKCLGEVQTIIEISDMGVNTYWGLLLKMVCKQLSGEYWVLVVWTFHFIPISTCFLITKNGLRCFVFLKFSGGFRPPTHTRGSAPGLRWGCAPDPCRSSHEILHICWLARRQGPLKQKSWLRPWVHTSGDVFLDPKNPL